MSTVLSLFEGYGIEIEWMIVDGGTLDVRPIADELLRSAAGSDEWVEDAVAGQTAWSNELVAHLLELKTDGPAASFEGLAQRFEQSVRDMNELARARGACLLPSGMHPWMDPVRETRIWPHSYAHVYQAYDRLFDCRRHGWSNVQSVHLNLPFCDEREFARLMAAVRLALPLLPALAAASPVVEGRVSGFLDSRLHHYRTNSARVPAMTGLVIPEAVYGFEEYRSAVLDPIDRELETLGADEALLHQPFTNARGAIARFDRMAIELRLLDAQECPRADLAIAATVSGLVRALVEERWSSYADQAAVRTEDLAALLARTIEHGPAAPLDPGGPARALFGPRARGARSAGELWRALAEDVFAGPAELEPPLALLLREGTLAERILRALGGDVSRPALRRVWSELRDCLAGGRSFVPR